MTDVTLVPGDIREVFTTSTASNRGQWSVPKTVCDIYGASCTASVPPSSGRTMRAAREYVLHPLEPESLASFMFQGNDALDVELESVLSFDPSADGSVEQNVP